MGGIGVFGDVQIFLDNTSHVREKRSVGAHADTVFIRFGNVVGADRDHAIVADFELTMELNKPFRLPSVLWGRSHRS